MNVKHATRFGLVTALVGATVLFSVSEDAPAAPRMTARYLITITNVTRGQIFSPPIAVTHSGDFSLFELGQPASLALALMAEDGDTSMLASEFAVDADVLDHRGAAGPVMPGATTGIVVIARPDVERISLGGMLVSTNDAFFALRNVPTPAPGERITLFARAYDAGSDANSEDCSFIPGPPCGNGGVHDPAPAEGYVHVHAGIHGNGTLDAAERDWRDVVAQVTVERMLQ